MGTETLNARHRADVGLSSGTLVRSDRMHGIFGTVKGERPQTRTGRGWGAREYLVQGIGERGSFLSSWVDENAVTLATVDDVADHYRWLMLNGPAVDFFFENAGWSHDPARETPEEGQRRHARLLADAERKAEILGWSVEWEVDPDPMWDDDVERETTDYEQWVCVLRNAEGDALEALGSIDLGPNVEPYDAPYARVVAAELALEALA